MQKESNQTKQRKSNGERNQLRSTNLDLGQIFTVAKTGLSWLNGKRVSRGNSRSLNRPIPIKERKVILKRKSDRKSQSETIAENPRKRKTDEQFNERTFVNCN